MNKKQVEGDSLCPLFKRKNPHIIQDCVVHSLTNVLLLDLRPQRPWVRGQKLASQFYICFFGFFGCVLWHAGFFAPCPVGQKPMSPALKVQSS